MQYLSKAYNYYSGINPATLSGAIDVIVVRHVDPDGTVTLSSSPFHVRFGKLQVLRAAEKRVTIRMPNNLPSPHVAPFSMKVGDTGEAFFVVETDQQVPEDLLTSPVVLPTYTENELPPTPPLSDQLAPPLAEPADHHKGGSLTNEPFGETEQQVPHEEPLAEVDFLDLDGGDGGDRGEPNRGNAANLKSPTSSSAPYAPSSLLPSLLPSLPHPLPPSSAPPPASGDPKGKSANNALSAPPPNPLEAKHGESTDLPEHNDKLSEVQSSTARSGSGEALLPKVRAGHGEGPQVLYGRDVVLDMAGYHSAKAQGAENDSAVETFIQDLLASVQPTAEGAHAESDADVDIHTQSDGDQPGNNTPRSPLRPTPRSTPPPRARRPPRKSLSADTDIPTYPTYPAAASHLDPELDIDEIDDTNPGTLPASLSALYLQPNASARGPRQRVRAGFDRGQSEPPQTASPDEPLGEGELRDDSGRSPDRPARTAAEIEWDWSRRRPTSALERSASGPTGSTTEGLHGGGANPARSQGKLKNVEENPFMFVLEVQGRTHTFELALCEGFHRGDASEAEEDATFVKNRLTFQTFIENPRVVDDPNIVVRYNDVYFTWGTGYRLLYALAMYRRTLLPPGQSPASPTLPALSDIGIDASAAPRSSGYGWSRWWRRGQSAGTGGNSTSAAAAAAAAATARAGAGAGATGLSPGVIPAGESASAPPGTPASLGAVTPGGGGAGTAPGGTTPKEGAVGLDSGVGALGVQGLTAGAAAAVGAAGEVVAQGRQYAKTLRLSSDQLEQLHLKSGPNTIQFSVTSSYSGLAICTARIFLWEDTDQIVISDIDGTITKSDALGHVFAAIGRDWTHLGIAKLYTDICNNGYKIMYLTSRAIGQADSTREYLKSIVQGNYRLPEGPVIMSPDRLMASLHREVIMRKPELFKMACLRDIQRLFGPEAKEAFYAGFGNRITDAMSYRSVGIEASKIYTIDSAGVVKTELLQSAGHTGSYIQLNDLVNEVFPPVSTKFRPEYTDFNYWRDPIPSVDLPDLTPPSPALSARSDTSGRLSVLGKIAGIGRRSSRANTVPSSSPYAASQGSMDPSSRPSSPLIAPSLTSDDFELSDVGEGADRFGEGMQREGEGEGEGEEEEDDGRSVLSMPGSFEDKGRHMGDSFFDSSRTTGRRGAEKFLAERVGEEGGEGEEEEGEERVLGEGEDGEQGVEDDSFDDDAIFDDDILAAGEMQHVPF